ncbi:FeoB-associated Cys-rich membrane protein [Amedibacillus sp. YH-ame10]
MSTIIIGVLLLIGIGVIARYMLKKRKGHACSCACGSCKGCH